MKMPTVLLSVFVLAILILSGCKAPSVVPSNETTGNAILEGSCPASGNSTDVNCQIPTDTGKTPVVTEINISAPTESDNSQQVNEPKDVAFKVEATEGDLVAIKPNAYSPDDVKLAFTFSEPFNENGL